MQGTKEPCLSIFQDINFSLKYDYVGHKIFLVFCPSLEFSITHIAIAGTASQQRKHSLHGTVVSKTQMLGQKNLAVLLSFVPFVSKCWSLHAAVLKTLSNGPSHNSNEYKKKNSNEFTSLHTSCSIFLEIKKNTN